MKSPNTTMMETVLRSLPKRISASAFRKGSMAAVLALFLTGACKSPLDIEPPFEVPTDQALNTTDNLESALNGAYAAAVSSNALGGALRLFPDAMSDHQTPNGLAVARGNLPTSLQNISNRLLFGVADGVWRSCYQAINRANNIIAAIDQGKVTNQDLVYRNNVARIRGEALFIRAVMHFELCRMFGLQYGEPGFDDPNAQRGVILRTSPSDDRVGLPRASVLQVYNQCIADLDTAISLLPEERAGQSVSNNFLPTYGGRVGGRATKDAARAYLARMYFQMGTQDGNTKALTYINQVLPATTDVNVLRNLLDDYTKSDGSRLSLADENPFNKRGFKAAKETIFQVVNAVDEATGTFNTSNGLLTSAYVWNTSGAQFPSYYLSSLKFFRDAGYDQNNDNNNDLRYAFFTQFIPTDNAEQVNCRPDRTNTKVISKYSFLSLPAPYDPNIGVINVQVLRLAELLVTRAELSLMGNDRAQAVADINALRRRAYGVAPGATTFDVPASLSDADLFRLVRRERMRELLAEGDRLYNLRRMDRVFKNGISLPIPQQATDYYLGGDGGRCERILTNLSVNDPQLLFQIPDAELSSNPNIRRN